jgi:hypothetical protein
MKRIMIVVTCFAFSGAAMAQPSAFDQGQRDGYNGGMTPGAAPGWSYSNGRQQGEQQRAADDYFSSRSRQDTTQFNGASRGDDQ